MTAPSDRRPRVLSSVRLGVLGLVTIVSYGSWFYGFGILLPDIADEFATGVGILAFGYALAQILTGLLGVITGRLLDRRGAAVAFGIGAAIGPVAIFASSFASRPWFFALMFGFGGGVIGATGFYQLTQAVVARLSPGDEARSIAGLTIWGAFAAPIMMPLTEVLRSAVGWRDTLRIGAVAVAMVLAVAALVVDRDRSTRATAPSSDPLGAIRLALASPGVRRLALSSLAGSFGVSAMIVLQVPAMVVAGLDRSLAASLAGARGIAQLLGRLPLTRVLGFVTARQALRGAKVMLAIGTVLLIFSGNVVVAIAFVVVGGASVGAMSPLDGIYAREVLPAGDLGTLMGALFLLSGIAAGLGPLGAAMLIDLTGSTYSGLLVAAAMSLLSAAILRPTTSPSADCERSS